MKTLMTVLLSTTLMCGAASAATIFPLDRATILSGAPFDFKIEFDQVYEPKDITVMVNGKPYSSSFGHEAQYIAVEKDKDGKDLGSALLLRDLKLNKPGAYKVEVKAGNESKTVQWDVFQAANKPKAKNVIFLLGDGMSMAHRTAARIMSKGMSEGKANGRLNMDDFDNMAFIGTSATNAIATDSANTMSAYMTGHKSAVNAIGVYADRTPDTFDDPKVETLGEALRRTGKKSLGIVTTAEIEDATPAAVVSHTRNRYDKAEIVGMIENVRPDVVLGGGRAYFLPQSNKESKRKDDKDYITTFKDAGYQYVSSKSELLGLNDKSKPLLGLFHPGNMDVILDRDFLKKGSVEKYPDQPGLVEMTKVALDRLSQNKDGFFLMVEGASIDKMSHPMDWDRALYETIEFDQAIGVAKEFAKTHPDTLVVVTADHTHGVSLIGTIDDSKNAEEMRDKIGVYQHAGFPNYEDKNGDGYPDKIDVDRRLMLFSSNFPDYYETYHPKMDGPFKPTVKDENKHIIPNEAYKEEPGAVLRQGNLPHDEGEAVHAVDDVVLQASGPTASEFKGYMEESDVYRVLADALGLGAQQK